MNIGTTCKQTLIRVVFQGEIFPVPFFLEPSPVTGLRKKGFVSSVLFVRVLQPRLSGGLDAHAFVSFGIITPVLSLVLSVFMLGLAAGSWAGGRFIASLVEKTGLSAGVFYAGVEFVIGLGAFAVPKLFALGEQPDDLQPFDAKQFAQARFAE